MSSTPGDPCPRVFLSSIKVLRVYRSVASACLLNTVDMLVLGIEDGAPLPASSPVGHVVLSARSADGVARGEIFMTIGPYPNHIISSETHGTGMPDFKNQRVDVEATDEQGYQVSRSSWKRSGGCAMIVSDVVCPFCGCLCDDLELEVKEDQDPACTERVLPFRSDVHE